MHDKTSTREGQMESGVESIIAKPLSHTPFAGQFSAEYNALRSALHTAAIDYGESGEYAEYDFLKNAPRTSFTVELVNALHKHGYEIRKASSDPRGLERSSASGVAANPRDAVGEEEEDFRRTRSRIKQ